MTDPHTLTIPVRPALPAGMTIAVSDGPGLSGYRWTEALYGDETFRGDFTWKGIVGMLDALAPDTPVQWDERDGRSIRAEDLAAEVRRVAGRAA